MKKGFLLCLFFLSISINPVFSTTKNWNAGANGAWETGSNWNPTGVPGAGDDVVINGNYTVTVSSDRPAESILLTGGADLVIAADKTLTVAGNSGDGVELTGIGTTLTVYGILNSSNHTNGGDGLKVGPDSFVMVEASGSIIINNVVEDGIDLDDNLTNEGIISITNPGEIGINTGGTINRYLLNNGSITVSGGTVSIDGKGVNWFITNNGTISLSNASTTLVDDGTNIDNFGTFIGEGNVENGNDFDVTFEPGSTLKPGTSVGTLSFTDILDLTGVNLDIEINGASNYDQILVEAGIHGPADVTISGAFLNLSGSYTPVAGDEFMILEKIHPDPIDGTFSGLPEGATFTYKGGDLMISYTGGNGNDITLTALGPLPIELVSFSAKSIENEVELDWVTATETNNDFFTIERSIDARNFQELATIPGKGNSLTLNEYSIFDKHPLNGLSYYRLKQTDFDGQFSYSEIETVAFHDHKHSNVFPTLVADHLTVETDNDFSSTLVVRNLTGSVFKSLVMVAKEYAKEISLIELLPGDYFITIYSDTTIETFKFIKL